MPTRTRTWIGVGLVCLAWLQGAGAQNAPGEDPVVLDRKVSIQMLPNGAAPRSGDMNPSSEMPAWQKARIAHVQASGELGRRIRDMGLIPGAEVEVVGRAPLRDPVALRLPGFTLSLRNNEADYIVVEPLESN